MLYCFRRLALAVTALAISALPVAASQDDGVAVIIGNAHYGKGLPQVDFAHRDAEAVKRFVVDVLGFREGNVIDLRDAGKAEMEAVFGNERRPEGKLYNWVREDVSDVVVFYSGHGAPGLKDGRGYLLPVDTDPELLEINGYPVDLLYANLARVPAKSVTVLIDACFSGSTPGGLLVQGVSGINVTPKLPESGNRLTVLTAAQGDQMAHWDEDAKHGLFTEYLLRALYGAADEAGYGNDDGQVTLDEVKTYLDKEMTYAARRRWGRMQDATVMGKGHGPMVSYQGAKPKRPMIRISTAPEPEPASASAASELGSDAEVAFWESIRMSRSAQEYRAYLEAYPEGRFASLARVRIDQIEEMLQRQRTATPTSVRNAPPPPRPDRSLDPGAEYQYREFRDVARNYHDEARQYEREANLERDNAKRIVLRKIARLTEEMAKQKERMGRGYRTGNRLIVGDAERTYERLSQQRDMLREDLKHF